MLRPFVLTTDFSLSLSFKWFRSLTAFSSLYNRVHETKAGWQVSFGEKWLGLDSFSAREGAGPCPRLSQEGTHSWTCHPGLELLISDLRRPTEGARGAYRAQWGCFGEGEPLLNYLFMSPHSPHFSLTTQKTPWPQVTDLPPRKGLYTWGHCLKYPWGDDLSRGWNEGKE